MVVWPVNQRQSRRLPSRSQVHCISTEFTPRKHGGEKGVPFRIQIDTFAKGDGGEYGEHLHSASCQIKVFKVRRGIVGRGGVTAAAAAQPVGPLRHTLSLLFVPLFSQRGPIGSRRRTGRRWRNAQLRRRRSTSLLTIPLSCQRSVAPPAPPHWRLGLQTSGICSDKSAKAEVCVINKHRNVEQMCGSWTVPSWFESEFITLNCF